MTATVVALLCGLIALLIVIVKLLNEQGLMRAENDRLLRDNNRLRTALRAQHKPMRFEIVGGKKP